MMGVLCSVARLFVACVEFVEPILESLQGPLLAHRMHLQLMRSFFFCESGVFFYGFPSLCEILLGFFNLRCYYFAARLIRFKALLKLFLALVRGHPRPDRSLARKGTQL